MLSAERMTRGVLYLAAFSPRAGVQLQAESQLQLSFGTINLDGTFHFSQLPQLLTRHAA